MKKLFKVQSSKFKVHGSKVKDLEPAEGNLEHAAAPWALGAVLVALAGAPIGAPAMAEELTDPTRPPPGFEAEGPAGESVVGPVNRLQSVIIFPKRKAAIINGVVVELGGKYGDAVLTKVAEDEVVLRSGDSQEVLKLYPTVEKVGVAPGGARSAPRDRKPKTKEKAKPNAATRPGAGAADGGGTRETQR